MKGFSYYFITFKSVDGYYEVALPFSQWTYAIAVKINRIMIVLSARVRGAIGLICRVYM